MTVVTILLSIVFIMVLGFDFIDLFTISLALAIVLATALVNIFCSDSLSSVSISSGHLVSLFSLSSSVFFFSAGSCFFSAVLVLVGDRWSSGPYGCGVGGCTSGGSARGAGGDWVVCTWVFSVLLLSIVGWYMLYRNVATSICSALTTFTMATAVASSKSSTYFSLLRWFSTLKLIPDNMSKKSIGCGFVGKLSSSASDSLSPLRPTFFLFFCMLLFGSLAALWAAPKMNVNFAFSSSDRLFRYYSFAVRSSGCVLVFWLLLLCCSLKSSIDCASSSIFSLYRSSISFICYLNYLTSFLVYYSSAYSSFTVFNDLVEVPVLSWVLSCACTVASSARSC